MWIGLILTGFKFSFSALNHYGAQVINELKAPEFNTVSATTYLTLEDIEEIEKRATEMAREDKEMLRQGKLLLTV